MTFRHIRATSAPYAHIINTANSEWYNADTTSFETFNGSNLADYAVAAGSQFGTTGIYPWEFPSGIAAGQYTVLIYDGDDDSLIEAGVVDWTGTALKIEPNLGATAPTDWIKPAAIQDGAFTAAKFASGAFDAVWSVSTRTLSSFGSLVADIYSYFINGTRADAFKADVSGLSTYDGSDTTGTATLLSRLSSTRAGYLDKLNVSGTIAHSDAAATYQADVSGLSTFDASSDTVTVGTNNDKTGYSLVSTGLDAITAWAVAITGNITGNLSGSVGSVTAAVTTDSPSREASKATGFAVAGDQMDIVNAPNATAVTAIQNGLATSAAQTTAQNDLNILTGVDGAILATAQANYAPAKVGDAMVLSATGLQAITAWTVDITGSLSGSVGSVTGAVGSVASPVETDSASRTASQATGFATPANVTDAQAAIISQGNTAWATATGFSTLDAAGVRTAIGLTSANLDTQLGDIPTVTEFNARSLPSGDYFVVGDYTVPPTAAEIAGFDMATIEDTAPLYSTATIVMQQLNSEISGGNLLIKKSDGSTMHTRSVPSQEGANPAIGIGDVA